jgi:uncharacterized protein
MPKSPAAHNVLGGELAICSADPRTGFLRDGCCQAGEEDPGRHYVCVQMTREFLEFSLRRGNDLSTPRPEWGFPGLTPGDRWCLCVERWKEAADAGIAPPVILEATHEKALDVVTLGDLLYHALANTTQ